MAHIDDIETQRANLAFIRRAMRVPMLERDTELALAHAWRATGNEAALHQLVRPYQRLVIALAHKFRHYGLPLGDLVQEGNIGLMQAAARFEPERNLRFSTYASWWIRAAVQDFVLRNWSIVRTGTTAAQKTLFFNLRRLRAKLAGSDGRLSDAGRQQIAHHTGLPLRDVTQMDQRLTAGDQSLSAPLAADSTQNWQDMLPDPGPDPEQIVMNTHDTRLRHRWLKDAMDTLDTRERQIIMRRRLTDAGITLEDLGAELGVSKTPIREALLRLRTEGLVHILPQRGTFVFQLSTAEAHALSEFRSVLEIAALRLAMHRDLPALAQALRTIVNTMKPAKTMHESLNYRALDDLFHRCIVEHCHNAYLSDSYESIALLAQTLRNRLAVDAQLNARSLKDHKDLVRLIERGQVEKAAAQLEKHIAKTPADYAKRLAPSIGARRTGQGTNTIASFSR